MTELTTAKELLIRVKNTFDQTDSHQNLILPDITTTQNLIKELRRTTFRFIGSNYEYFNLTHDHTQLLTHYSL